MGALAVLSFIGSLVSTGGQIALSVIGGEKSKAQAETELQSAKAQLEAEEKKHIQQTRLALFIVVAVLLVAIITIFLVRRKAK